MVSLKCNAGHHDYEYEIEQVVTGLTETMYWHFGDWVCALPMPAPPACAQRHPDSTRHERAKRSNASCCTKELNPYPKQAGQGRCEDGCCGL
jgi:hypothetical protein